jgi:hypothetical protein
MHFLWNMTFFNHKSSKRDIKFKRRDCFMNDNPTLHLSLFFLSCVCSDREKQLNCFIMEPTEFIAGKTTAWRPLSCISAYRAPCLQQIRLRAINPRKKACFKADRLSWKSLFTVTTLKGLTIEKIPLWACDDLLVGTLWRCKKSSDLHAMVGKFKMVYLQLEEACSFS